MAKKIKKNAKKSAGKRAGKPASKSAGQLKVSTSIETTAESKIGIRPLYDRVIIKEDTESKERQTATGIIIPVSASEDKGSKRGEVVAVGPGRVDDGVQIPIDVKVGDKVLFQWGDKVKVNEEEYYLVRESEILAVVK